MRTIMIDMIDCFLDIVHDLRRDDIIQILRSVIAQLKPRYRTVIELRFFEELSYEEIAARLQLPMGTVKVHIKRARDLMYNIIINNEAMIKELHLNK